MKNFNFKSYTAGLVLFGFEVKIIKFDNIELKISEIIIKNMEIFINLNNYKIKRNIKLLLNKLELVEIMNYNKKYKIIPERIIFKKSLIKLKIILRYENLFYIKKKKIQRQ